MMIKPISKNTPPPSPTSPNIIPIIPRIMEIYNVIDFGGDVLIFFNLYFDVF